MSSSLRQVYTTQLGQMWHGDALDLLAEMEDESVNLILTSPPFPLTRSKAYGNELEGKYVDWLLQFAWEFHRVLTQDGSLVIDLGGAWLPGKPSRSLYQFRLLIELVDQIKFHLAEDFYWFNRAKLPGPRQWVTIDRVRVKDAVNTIWWLSKSENPKADNRNVLRPYSRSMLKLLQRGTYNEGLRPSDHKIGDKWAKDQGGAIPPNVIETDHPEVGISYEESQNAYDSHLDEALEQTKGDQPDNMLDFSNTVSVDSYHAFCRANNLRRHPARFPREVPQFFIKFLTDAGDLVFDPFGGSNVTGAVAEELNRRWVACELDSTYVAGSLGRFTSGKVTITRAGREIGLAKDLFAKYRGQQSGPGPMELF